MNHRIHKQIRIGSENRLSKIRSQAKILFFLLFFPEEFSNDQIIILAGISEFLRKTVF